MNNILSSIRYFLVVLILFVFFAFKSSPINASYTQTSDLCYSQCSAYRFVWRGDTCYDLFINQCSVGSKDIVKQTISFIKDIISAAVKGDISTLGVENAFKAMFICKPLIEECIVPQLKDCKYICSLEPKYYAPNISAGSNWGSIDHQGVYYDETNHNLIFKVINNGLGYASDIDVTASWGHTRNQDRVVSGGGTLFTEKIPELLFLGARVGAPKTPGDYVTDFLIEESNFAKYLQGFKSDADNYYVPPVWYKVIPFTAPSGEFTKVTLNVDQNQMIPESSESDNTFVLEIDDLPMPASFQIDKLTSKRTNPKSLTEYMTSFEVNNVGEESGNAVIKWYQDKYTPGKTSFYETSMIIPAKDKVLFDHIINVDVSKGGNSCNYFQNYTIVIFDDKGIKQTERGFNIPLFAGSISGRVEDLFGKKIVGATITTSTGQTTTVNDSGYYHIGGIGILGKVTVTATHPEFSKPESKEVEISFDDSKDRCHIEGLSQTRVDFILKDQDVMFNVIVKDRSGNPIPAHVLASNKDWRFEQDVSGQTPLPGMQPGEYAFTISASGYKTISQTVNAVPNNQNLEFVMEKLNGRLTDGGLVIHEPQLLWQMDRGEEILSQVTATKDGNQVMIYTTKNKANTGKLYFLKTETGDQIKVISGTTATGGNSQACLDTSYDGNTTALYVHNGTAGMAQNTRNVLKLFNSLGNEIGMTDFKSGGGAHNCDVSPDGFYVYPDRLMNKGLYVYTRHDILGIENSKADMGYVSNDTLHFTTANNIVAGCPKGGGQCVQIINRTVVTNLNGLDGSIRKVDSNQTGNRIGLTTVKKVYFFSDGTKTWEKDIKNYGDLSDISVSPGGKFIIYSTASASEPYRSIKIYTDNNISKTPPGSQNGKKEDVVFVHANDKGIYYLVNDHKTLKFYKVGSYSTDYNPPSSIPTSKPETNTGGLSFYSDGNFFQARTNQSFSSLEEGVIYMANRNINLDMGGNNGGLNILEGTIFSIDANHRPILLKGQMTANFNSPAIIYAIKFDRFDMTLFRTKLNQFRSNSLPESEYFVVKNIHTKFTVRNNDGKINVAVDNGEVKILGKKINIDLKQGKQITIDKNNKINESFYINFKFFTVIIGILILILSALLFKYRKTKTGIKIIKIIENTVLLIWKYFKHIIVWLWEIIKKIKR